MEDLEERESVIFMHRILNKMNAKILGDRCFDHIKKLENSVIRGEGKPLKSPRKASRLKKHPKGLETYLKAQHKISDKGKLIVSLPKQAYGSHETYSNYEDFCKIHFIEPNKRFEPEKLKEIEDLTRKFRLSKKRQVSPQKRPMSKNSRLSHLMDKQVFTMRAGDLVCKTNDDILSIYESDLAKFRETGTKMKTVDQRQHLRRSSQVYERLHPKNNFKGGRLYQKMTNKYSCLFATEEVRPSSALYATFN